MTGSGPGSPGARSRRLWGSGQSDLNGKARSVWARSRECAQALADPSDARYEAGRAGGFSAEGEPGSDSGSSDSSGSSGSIPSIGGPLPFLSCFLFSFSSFLAFRAASFRRFSPRYGWNLPGIPNLLAAIAPLIEHPGRRRMPAHTTSHGSLAAEADG